MTEVCKDCYPDPDARAAARIMGGHRSRTGKLMKAREVVEGSGGRCATHAHVEKRRKREASHERRVQGVYGLPSGGYRALYEFQGGVCAICRRATGRSRRLSVDHDHRSGLVRGLLCRPCNDLLGHIRDDLDTVKRVHHYLTSPPARELGIVAVHKENRND